MACVALAAFAGCSDVKTEVATEAPRVAGSSAPATPAGDSATDGFRMLLTVDAQSHWHQAEVWRDEIARQKAVSDAVRAPVAPENHKRGTPAPKPPAGTGHGGSVAEAIAHWFPDNPASAARVANCESTLRPGAVNGPNRGLFQISNVHAKAFEQVTGQPYQSGSLNAWFNAQYAAALHRSSGWGPWACRWAA